MLAVLLAIGGNVLMVVADGLGTTTVVGIVCAIVAAFAAAIYKVGVQLAIWPPDVDPGAFSGPLQETCRRRQFQSGVPLHDDARALQSDPELAYRIDSDPDRNRDDCVESCPVGIHLRFSCSCFA